VKQKYLIKAFSFAAVLAFVVGVLGSSSLAAGDASFNLSSSPLSYTTGQTITLNVSESSSSADNANSVQMNLSYPSSLTYDSVTPDGPFTLCAQQTGGGGAVNLACASTSAESGTQAVARVVFTASSAGTASVSIASGSNIDNTSGNSVYNGQYPSISYTISNPSSGGGTSGGGSSGGGSTGGSSGGSTGSTGKTTYSPPPTTTTTNTKTSSPTASSSPTPKKTTPVSTPPSTKTSSSTAPSPQPASNTPGSDVQIRILSGKSPVKNAKVTLTGTTTITNSNGYAVFTNIAPGSYTVKVTAPGKKSKTVALNVVSGQPSLINIKLANSFSFLPIFIMLAILILVGIVILLIKTNTIHKIRQRLVRQHSSADSVATGSTAETSTISEHPTTDVPGTILHPGDDANMPPVNAAVERQQPLNSVPLQGSQPNSEVTMQQPMNPPAQNSPGSSPAVNPVNPQFPNPNQNPYN
jgi:hypothetical protein